MRRQKIPKHSPLSDPTAKKILTSNWEGVRGSQRTTFPGIISASEMSILWFPTILLPLVSFSFFLSSTFLKLGSGQMSHPIRALKKVDWHSLVDNWYLHTLYSAGFFLQKDEESKRGQKYTFLITRHPLVPRSWQACLKSNSRGVTNKIECNKDAVAS